ncbi:catechol 1,2-dioxygenase [Streptomyces sp. NPDC091217]|uniref:dioxygenase family protein n=1 Tax=Streptomyces sp. NPDC091217 TaxID=3365975 RepID=UPI0037FE21D3
MDTLNQRRLQVVVNDLRRAINDVIIKHQVTPMELMETVGWVQKVAVAEELMTAGLTLFIKPVLEGTEGASYAHPEKDGASAWEMEGPAHIPGAPLLESPCVLPMRPDEPGDPVVVSGTVRSTTGEPIPGAVLDLWQPDANCVYSGMTTENFLPLDIPNDSSGIPEYNLRGRVVADSEGRYEFRTVAPGIEPLGLNEGNPVTELAENLGLAGVRPLHIHYIVSAEGHHTLITQLYFDGDPLVNATIEGPMPLSAIKRAELRDDPADYTARGLSVPYRAISYDLVLRPAAGAEPATAAV